MTEPMNMAKAWADIDPPKKYRLVRADTMEPLGDWGTNLQETMEYLERRPDWAPKYVCVDENGRVIPSVVGIFDPQCGLVKMSWTEAAQYEKNNPNALRDEEAEFAAFEAAAETAATQRDPSICMFCGSGCIDIDKELSVYCHDCKREYTDEGEEIFGE